MLLKSAELFDLALFFNLTSYSAHATADAAPLSHVMRDVHRLYVHFSSLGNCACHAEIRKKKKKKKSPVKDLSFPLFFEKGEEINKKS